MDEIKSDYTSLAHRLGTLTGEIKTRRINLEALARTMGDGWQRDYLRDQIEGIDRALAAEAKTAPPPTKPVWMRAGA
jgi:hypothetical protein